MIVDSQRVIENSERIQKKIEQCLKLIERDDLQIDDETFANFKQSLQEELDEKYLNLAFVKSLKAFWNKYSNEKKIFIYQLLNDNKLRLPKYEPPQRNPELECRIQALKAQIAEDDYQKMVSNVNYNSSSVGGTNKPKSGLVPEFKSLQGQVVAIFNMILVIAGAFVFGYKAVEYSLDSKDITKQMMGGFVLAVIVAIADIYFLFKKLMRLDERESTSKPKIKRSVKFQPKKKNE